MSALLEQRQGRVLCLSDFADTVWIFKAVVSDLAELAVIVPAIGSCFLVRADSGEELNFVSYGELQVAQQFSDAEPQVIGDQLVRLVAYVRHHGGWLYSERGPL